MRSWLVCVLLVSCALSACGDDASVPLDAGGSDLSSPGQDAEALLDAGIAPDSGRRDLGADGGSFDLGADAGPRTGPCAERLYDDRNIPLDALGRSGQIHPSIAYDGDTLWVAYNLPNDDGFFDPYLTRLYCDGTVLLPPVRVSTTVSSTTGPNHTDPTLLLAHDRVYVFWQMDNRTGINNLDILFRVFDRDGSPLDAENQVMVMEREGRTQFGNTWLPKIAALPNGLALVGAWAHDEAQRFQVFVQRLDVDGAPTEDAFDVALEPTTSQYFPAVATSSAGDILVAWQEEEDDGTPYVSYGWAAPGASTLTGTAAVGGFPTVNPSLTFEYGEAILGLTRVLGGQGRPELLVLSSAHTEILGNPNRYDHSPSVAREPDGGAVFHFRVISGSRSQVVFVPFGLEGGVINRGAERVIETTDPAAAYEPTLAVIEPGLYFLAWSEGRSPDLRLHGRFVRRGP